MANVMIRRANVVLEIPDDEAIIDKYLAGGYDLIGPDGKIVKHSTHGRSENELRSELEALQKKNDRLVQENTELKAKLEALVAGMNDEPSVEESELTVEAPKKKRSTKSKN